MKIKNFSIIFYQNKEKLACLIKHAKIAHSGRHNIWLIIAII